MAEDVTASRLHRLEFQRQAQEVQATVTGVVRELNALVREVHTQQIWPPSAVEAAKRLSRSAYEGLDAWLALAPTSELLSLWEEIGNRLERLGPLLQEFAALDAVAAEKRHDMLNALMARYRQWLQEMNVLEAQLLEREMDMAGLRDVSAQAARNHRPT